MCILREKENPFLEADKTNLKIIGKKGFWHITEKFKYNEIIYFVAEWSGICKEHLYLLLNDEGDILYESKQSTPSLLCDYLNKEEKTDRYRWQGILNDMDYSV